MVKKACKFLSAYCELSLSFC